MNKFFISVLAAAGLTTLLLLIMYTPLPGANPEAKTQLLFSASTVVLGLGAITFYIKSLKNFKPGLRVPYTLLSAGIIMVALPQIALATGLFFNLKLDTEEVPWLAFSSLLAIVLGTPVMYLSIRKFAKLLSVRSIWTTLKIIVPGILILSILLGIAIANLISETEASLGYALVIHTVLYACVAAVVALRLRTMLGPMYLSAMEYLAAAFGTTAFAYAHDSVITGVSASTEAIQPYLPYLYWPYLLLAFLFLKAGQEFWKASQSTTAVDANATYIDTITYVAGLASNPRALDEPLDKLRAITASMSGDKQQLSLQEKTTLMELYREIEMYLTTQDPLRTFTANEIRSHLTYDFQQALKAGST